MWAQILKTTFFLSLFSVCFIRFGLPCLKKFLANKVIVNEFVTKNISLKPPAITICPQKWKNQPSPMTAIGNYRKNCENANGANDFSDCVANKTFGFDEVILFAQQGIEDVSAIKLSDPNLWTSDMTLTTGGRCYTLKYDQELKVDFRTDSIVINLAVIDYFIFLHNPDFFLVTLNPLTVPVKYMPVNPQDLTNTSCLGLTLEAVQRHNLDRDGAQCNSSPDYNFTACVKKSLARIVNCTLPWNDKITGNSFLHKFSFAFNPT